MIRPFRSFFALALLCSLIASCANTDAGLPWKRSRQAETEASGGVQRATLRVGEIEREFASYTPKTASTEALPIVVYLHGHGDNMRHILGEGLMPSASAQWMKVAEREGFLVLYPLGLKGQGRRAKTGWNDCRANLEGNPTEDDVAFFEALITHAASELQGNRRRVYVTGMSNGGHMAMRIAMERPELVAAVAPIVALLPKTSSCSPPKTPVPILMMHGTDDPLAPFEGGAMAGDRGEVLSAKATMETWVRWNGLEEAAEERLELADLDDSDDSQIAGSARYGETNGNAVVAYIMNGAGHTQPSRAAKLGRLLKRVQGNQNRDVEMAELLWEFFEPRSR